MFDFENLLQFGAFLLFAIVMTICGTPFLPLLFPGYSLWYLGGWMFLFSLVVSGITWIRARFYPDNDFKP